MAQWIARNVEVVGSSPSKGPRCFPEQETLTLHVLMVIENNKKICLDAHHSILTLGIYRPFIYEIDWDVILWRPCYIMWRLYYMLMFNI